MKVLASFFIEDSFYTIQEVVPGDPYTSHSVKTEGKTKIIFMESGEVKNQYNKLIGMIDWNSKGNFIVFEQNDEKNLLNFQTYTTDRVQSEISIARYILTYDLDKLYRAKLQDQAV